MTPKQPYSSVEQATNLPQSGRAWDQTRKPKAQRETIDDAADEDVHYQPIPISPAAAPPLPRPGEKPPMKERS